MHMIMWKWRRMKQQYGLCFAIFARHVRLIDLLTLKKMKSQEANECFNENQ